MVGLSASRHCPLVLIRRYGLTARQIAGRLMVFHPPEPHRRTRATQDPASHVGTPARISGPSRATTSHPDCRLPRSASIGSAMTMPRSTKRSLALVAALPIAFFGYSVLPASAATAHCGGAAATIVVGSHSHHTVRGTNHRDVIVIHEAGHVVNARGGDDLVCGSSGHDVVNGGAGDDRLLGRGGDDRLTGGRGDDDLVGGLGEDIEHGDAGDDRLVGQAG